MTDFLAGACAMAFVVAALFFLRFWQRTRDLLFLLFSVAFIVLACSDTFLALAAASPAESRPIFYLPRLVAYLLILAAIALKNRKRGA